MRSLHAALGLFTLIPVPPFDVDRKTATRAMRAMPWLGLLLGAVAGSVYLGGAWLGAPLVGAVGALAVLAGATGALHLDGVADTADGLGSRKPRDEALAIMKRSDIGPMGVVTLLFVLLGDLSAIVSLPTALMGAAAIASAAALARAAVMVASVSRSGARASGFGALFVGVTSPGAATLNGALVALTVLGMGWLTGGLGGLLMFAVAMMVAAVVAAGWGRHVCRRLGGWTGDTFGSLIEVTQLAFLVVAAVLPLG